MNLKDVDDHVFIMKSFDDMMKPFQEDKSEDGNEPPRQFSSRDFKEKPEESNRRAHEKRRRERRENATRREIKEVELNEEEEEIYENRVRELVNERKRRKREKVIERDARESIQNIREYNTRRREKTREEMLKKKREEREVLEERVVLPPTEKKKLEEISKKLGEQLNENDEEEIMNEEELGNNQEPNFDFLQRPEENTQSNVEELEIENPLRTVDNETNIEKISRIILEHYNNAMLAFNEQNDLNLDLEILSSSRLKIRINSNGGYVLQAIQFVLRENPTVPVVIEIKALRPTLVRGQMLNDEIDLMFSSSLEFLNGIAAREHMGDDENNEWEFYLEGEGGIKYLVVPPARLLNEIIIWVPKQIIKRKRIQGAFFPYCLSTDYPNLKDIFHSCDIYTEVESIKNQNTNCFVQCCIESGIFSDDEIKFIKSQINDHFVGFRAISSIFEKLNTSVKLTYRVRSKQTNKWINRGKERTMKIFMIRSDSFSHYFINKNINNPFGVGKISTYELIEKGIENKVLLPMSNDTLLRCRLGLMDKVEINLPEDSLLFTREITCKEKEDQENIIYYADLECITSGEKHEPFCAVLQGEREESPSYFYGFGCCGDLLEYLNNRFTHKKSIKVYFHNLSYDGRFFAKYGIFESIEKDNRIYSMKIMYKKKVIILKDSFALIPTGLKNFNSMFALGEENEKEIYPYNFITKENIESAPVDGVGDTENPKWDNDQKNEFLKKLQDMNLINGNLWDVKKYTLYYCIRDVKILRNGFNKFRKMCRDEINLDPVGFVSLSSMAFYYFKRNAFKNEKLVEYTGVVREYIRKAVYGGRCMTKRNKKFIVNDVIVDFDACSLYPSAMSRLYLPTGKPLLLKIDENTRMWLFDHVMSEKQTQPEGERFISCYVVTIYITKCRVHLDFPLIVKKVNGINYNVNEENIEMTIDNIYLEDLIKYHDIDFNIKSGIYWVGEKSIKLSEEIKKVYDLRNHYKIQKNPMQNIYKLLMNASYGKTIQKTSLKENVYKKSDELDTYWLNNYFNIIKAEKISDSNIYRVEKRVTVDEEYSPVIIGVLILSMSKRIMNELFDCAEKNKIDVFYQDTDSIHIKKRDLGLLEREFTRIYDRQLIGGDMGQFHTDFENITNNSTNVVSEKSIFLGKKAYIDCLVDDEGNRKNQVRMKGVPSINIIMKGEEVGGCWELYKRLYYGEAIEFDLLEYGPHFKFYKKMEIESLKCFKRKVRFGDKGEDLIDQKRDELIKKLMTSDFEFVALNYNNVKKMPEEIKKLIDVRNSINDDNKNDELKFTKRVCELSKYILFIYFCYTSEFNENSGHYIVSKLFECSKIIADTYKKDYGRTENIVKLYEFLLKSGSISFLNLDDAVSSNYDTIINHEDPISFDLNEPDDIAKSILLNLGAL